MSTSPQTKTSPKAQDQRSPGAVAGPSHTQLEAAPLESGGAAVEVEIDDSDTDSAIASGESTATTSVSSSVFEFTYANGRRYHSDRFRCADYFMPNDENEQERLDLYHHQFLQLLGGKLHAAPLVDPQRVLDVGTGTGIWAIDFAEENPQAIVVGTDVSPIQAHWVPPNCKFEVDDVEDDWTYEDNHFDYIHMRSLSGSFKDWPRVLKQAYDKTAPGGYVEFQDYGCELFLADGTPQTKPDPKRPFTEWLYHVVEGAKKADRPLVIAKHMKKMLEEAGFVDVVESTAIWPVGPWPKDKRLKEAGKWGLLGVLESLYPFGVQLLTKWQGFTVKEVEALCARVEKELPRGKYYFHGWFVYGRKPEA